MVVSNKAFIACSMTVGSDSFPATDPSPLPHGLLRVSLIYHVTSDMRTWLQWEDTKAIFVDAANASAFPAEVASVPGTTITAVPLRLSSPVRTPYLGFGIALPHMLLMNQTQSCCALIGNKWGEKGKKMTLSYRVKQLRQLERHMAPPLFAGDISCQCIKSQTQQTRLLLLSCLV